MKLLETEWNNLRQAAISKDAGSAQVFELRRAFFAGAWALYALIMEGLSPGHEPTDDDMKRMAAIDAELREFTERVRKGWA